MTVAELIAELQKFPPDAPVTVYDFENWSSTKVLKSIEPVEIFAYKHGDGYSDAKTRHTVENATIAVCLS